MPAFRTGKPRWRRRSAATQTLSVGTTTITFDTTEYADGDVTFGSTTVTVGKAGLYALSAGIGAGRPTGAHGQELVIVRNGVSVAAQTGASAAGDHYVGVSTQLELDAGDVLTITVRDFTNAGTSIANAPYFTGSRIGPVRWTG